VQIRPSGIRGDKKDVFGFVFVRIFRVCAFEIALSFEELIMKRFEGIGNVFEED